MSILLSALCAVSANLDTLAVSIAFGMKKVKISFPAALSISLISTLGTLLSMLFGVWITILMGNALLATIGAVIVMGMGVWFMIQGVREIRGNNHSPEVLSHPETADADHSGSIEMKESIALALALTVNNIGVGVAASVAGVSVWPATLLTFVTSLLAIKLGAGFGQQFIAGLLGLYASFLSGFVIFVVGLASLLA